MTHIIADAHVHLYPFYRFELAMEAGLSNLSRIARDGTDGVRILFMVERQGFSVFKGLRDGSTLIPGWDIKTFGDPDVVQARARQGDAAMFIVNGRQIATSERMEVLSLAAAPQLPDGLDAHKTVEEVIAAGGVPVLPWAPGKWMFERRKVVESLLNSFKPDQLLFGDTSLRPMCFPRPKLMKQAAGLGFKIVAGTDPLPFVGEERAIGRYGIKFMAELDENNVCASLRTSLLDPSSKIELIGRRNSALRVACRLFKNSRSKKVA